MSPVLDEEIVAAVSHVYDPCSLAQGIPMNVLEMGLVRSWTVSDGQLEITMIVTSAACWQAGVIAQAIEEAVAVLPGVTSAKVVIDGETLWGPELIGEGTRSAIAQSRADSNRVTGLRPQQWREQISPASVGAQSK